jgi:hypothetical protein
MSLQANLSTNLPTCSSQSLAAGPLDERADAMSLSMNLLMSLSLSLQTNL